MTYDASKLIRTSEKRAVPWRDTRLTFIWLRSNGPISSAYTIADKRQILENALAEDLVLAVREVRFPQHQEVMVIDEIDTARAALED